MRKLDIKYRKRRKYGKEASLHDLPSEILFESLFIHLSDRDIHNLGLAFGDRIENIANDHIPLGKISRLLSIHR